jgi:hypothetical protein
MIEDFLKHVIRPTLNYMSMGGRDAERLVLGTAIVESKLRHLKQVRGPALGFYQMEPATHDDLWTYINRKPEIKSNLLCLMTPEPKETQLITNLSYATAMCRIHYWRRPEKIPSDLEGLANYWKRFYNSPLGAGTVEKFMNECSEIMEFH